MTSDHLRAFSRFENPGPTYFYKEIGDGLFGALAIATLAYPEAKHSDLRLKTAMRLHARMYMTSLPSDVSWVMTKTSEGEATVPVDRRQLDGGWKQVVKRLQRRLVFGQLVVEPLVAFQQNLQLRNVWGSRWNRAEALRKYMAVLGLTDTHNFERDYWAPSLAVPHLAAACFILCYSENIERDALGLLRLVKDHALSEKLIRTAWELEPLVEASDLKIPTEVLIKFRMWLFLFALSYGHFWKSD